jgi:hypothetical protein
MHSSSESVFMEEPCFGFSSCGSKRRRVVPFPSGFEKQLIRSCARRSAFITAQLECAGEDGSFRLPEEECTLWLEAMLLTSSDLDSTDNYKIIDFLKVRSSWRIVMAGCRS